MPFDFFFFKNKRKPQGTDHHSDQLKDQHSAHQEDLSTDQRIAQGVDRANVQRSVGRSRSIGGSKNRQTELSRQTPGSRAQTEILRFLEHDIVIIRKAYRRSLSLSVQVNGQVRVSAPIGVTQEKVLSFLCAHEDWLRQHLVKFAVLRTQFPKKRFCENEQILFMGRPLTLRFQCAEGNQLRPTSRLFRANHELIVVVPQEKWKNFKERYEHPELIAPIRQFYKKTAQNYLSDRVGFWSERMRLQPKGLSFRSQKTRWGSCNSKGKISLNWRLMIAPVEVIDYVIVHELSHLVHYDHSRSFWNLVAQYSPDYKTQKTWLKKHQYEADFLSEESELHR